MAGRTPVTDRMDLIKDLNFDADDRIELVAAIELACRMDLPAAETAEATSVGDLIALVEARQVAADEALREAIRDLAAGAAARRQPIDPVGAARVLAGEHRSASLDMTAIEAAIVRAMRAHASPEDGQHEA
jgi:acyl carrier protein